jgi:hypothetical protein
LTLPFLLDAHESSLSVHDYMRLLELCRDDERSVSILGYLTESRCAFDLLPVPPNKRPEAIRQLPKLHARIEV